MPLTDEAVGESSSVEELIDLEQQAEFFVVLGQDDAAIDLLSQHLQDGSPASPLPYMKLLEIHRRRGDRLAYEALRNRFDRDFNARAPDWDADLEQGRSLEEYPEVLARLQRHWGTPSLAIETLDALLFRRGRSSTTFELPAYRELLSLYAIARERAQDVAGIHDELGAGVDLLLPLGSALGAGRAVNASARAVDVDVDVDVSMAAEVLPAGPGRGAKRESTVRGFSSPPASPLTAHYESQETVPSALRRSVGFSDESAFVDLELEPVGRAEPVVVR